MMPSPLWISHRGFCEAATENTIDAFEAARKIGFRAFETDLRLTADGHIVLSHDETLDRVAGISASVHRQTKQELQAVALPRGARLMFFEEILMRFLGDRWTLEFKPEYAEACIQKFLQIVGRERLHDWVQTQVKFLVYENAHEDLLKKHLPNAKFYACFRDCKRAALSQIFHLPFWKEIQQGKTYGLVPRFLGLDLFQKKYVDIFHQAGAEILAYLPKTQEQAKAAVAAGFDEILTDGRIL